ncbi:TonB-dependent receptor [Mucilaginibacter sp. CSA2-8R]|uniref:TonB-dependent receptor n=1 Tax=Mucilaginibacter sp. CSA2-8R TaxID=3141542 RepID=UPI00315CF57A
MKRFLWLLILCSNIALAQHQIKIAVTDSLTRKPVTDATVAWQGKAIAHNTDTAGVVRFSNITPGSQTFSVSRVGYLKQSFTLIFPLADTTQVYTVSLMPQLQEMEVVIVSSTRTNSRIEDLPMKVEVLGQEEMDEENMIKPGNVASILGDLSVIHVQQTSATTGNTTIRMQGLNGRYTQLLRDGLPLYDGFSGNFGVLSIPPLDLKQIEIIKGSSSTLYGGGAIAGLINFISKAPTTDRDLSFTLNRSTLKESNANGYFSQRFGKFGLTFTAQQTWQTAVDVNKDGFSDVPKINSTILHPRLFYYINNRSQLDAGYAFTHENRLGGDMQVIDNRPDAIHQYSELNQSYRNTFDFHYRNDLDSVNRLTVKGSVSNYNLNNVDEGFAFKGNQLSDYLEVNDLIKLPKQELIIGGNYTGEYFRKNSAVVSPLANYDYHTLGAFVQDGWHINPKFLVEAGLRADHHSRFGWFVLPRIALLYKPVSALSVRLSSGLGYKAPNVFIPETLAGSFATLNPLSSNLTAERSFGVNFDANYHVRLSDEATLDVDQALYYTNINNPLIPVMNADNTTSLNNAGFRINTLGTDTYVRLKIDELELYFGFNHTVAKQALSNRTIYLPFSPQNKISTTIAYEVEGQWRFGVEGSLETNQYINENQRVRNFPFLAAMVERKWGSHVSFVLNCENINDFRQSRYESLYTGTITRPVFKQLWAPIDGRAVNLAMRIKI